MMEPRRNPPEYFLEIFADSTAVKDVLKGTYLLNLTTPEKPVLGTNLTNMRIQKGS